MADSTGSYDVTMLRALMEAHRTRARVRLLLRKTTPGDATVRSVEGYAVEIATGTDGKARVRMSVPMGGGEPIEVRLELASIAMVQTVE